MIKSKIKKIKFLAYYKICNCFIIIVDDQKIESISFAQKQLENIFNSNNNNVLFIINQKQKNNKIDEKIKESINKKIKDIREIFNINPLYLDLSSTINKNKTINNFLNKSYIGNDAYEDEQFSIKSFIISEEENLKNIKKSQNNILNISRKRQYL